MKLTTRVAAAIVALVAITALASWIAANRLVFRPLVGEVLDAWVAEVGFVGEELDDGRDRRRIARALDVTVEPWTEPIPDTWRTRERDGRRVWLPPGPRNLLVVETAAGPIAVRRELDLQRPGRRLPLALGLVALVVVLIAGSIARRGVRPLTTATEAMARMAEGDLDHRLAEQGTPELVSAAAAFNRMADRIAALLRAEKQLLAGISHELRTPLTRLMLELELLRDAGVDPARLDRMNHDLEQLDGLVGEALELSRLSLGQRPLVRAPTSLRAIAEAAANGVDLEGRPLTVTGDATLSVDARLVERAVRNLLTNVARYTPAGTAVTLDIEPGGIEVRDAGPGVAPAELDRLGEPFFRTAEGARRAEGLGLGLMIVRQVLELHGGRVEARDAQPGLAVRLRFPTQ